MQPEDNSPTTLTKLGATDSKALDLTSTAQAKSKDSIDVVDDIAIFNDDHVDYLADDDANSMKKPRHLRAKHMSFISTTWFRIALAALSVLCVLLGLVVGVFALNHDDEHVMRNVKLGGTSIAGMNIDELRVVVSTYAPEFANETVTVSTPESTFAGTATDFGLTLDVEGTTKNALAIGHEGGFVSRFSDWTGSFIGDRQARLAVTIDRARVATMIDQRDTGPKTGAAEPVVKMDANRLSLIPTSIGRGINSQDLAAALAINAERAGDFEVKINRSEIEPRFSNNEAQKLVDFGNERTADGVLLDAEGTQSKIDTKTLRSWVQLSTADNQLALEIDATKATPVFANVFAKAGKAGSNATFKVTDAGVQIVGGATGTKCCGDNATSVVANALFSSKALSGSVEMPMITSEPQLSAETAKKYGITEQVASFTTKHAAGQPRVTNIHQIADLVRGTVIPPNGSISINSIVGARTTAKGFVADHAIEDGIFVEAVGGGISQFATTLFNASFFAGLNVPEYQAHSIYISRYPYGREATLSWPKPDLVIQNPSPYGVLIWPSYTGTSLTVNMYSTKWVTAVQSGQTTGTQGSCTTVRTERTMTFLDKSKKVDYFNARYRKGEGIACSQTEAPTTTTTTKPGASTTSPVTTTVTTVATTIPSSTVPPAIP